MNLPDVSPDSTLADRFAVAWQAVEGPPDVRSFLKAQGVLSLREVADVLLIDQAYRWRAECPIPAEQYLEAWPELAGDRELRLDLVYGEVRARSARNEPFDAASFAERFPDLDGPLSRQREVAQWFADALAGPDADWPTQAEPPATAAARLDAGPAVTDPEAPLPFSDFEIHERLGSGAMGEVFRAIQKSLGKPVAIKILKRASDLNREQARRFLREARAVAGLRHPSIVDVHGLGRCPDGGYFLVMDLIEGKSLQQRLREGPLPIDEAARIVADVADAIQHTHQQGIIHRDLKPSNVLLTAEGRPLVTDFGLAKHFQGQQPDLSVDGEIVGTPQYMAPEQAAPQWGQVGPATDVYGLGALLYALLTGYPPFRAAHPLEALTRLFSDEMPPPPHTFRPDIPAAVEMVCTRCLQKNPSFRYATAGEVAVSLRAAMGWEDAVPVTPGKAMAGEVGPASGRPAMFALSIAAVVLAGFSWWAVAGKSPAAPQTASVAVTSGQGIGSRSGSDSVGVKWEVDVFREGSPDRRVRLTEQPGPLVTGDSVQLRIALDEPRYAYLFWIGSEGTVERLYPITGPQDVPVAGIVAPTQEDHALPVLGPTGTEVAVLVLCREKAADLRQLAAAVRPTKPFPLRETVLLDGLVLAASAASPPGMDHALASLSPNTPSRSLGPAHRLPPSGESDPIRQWWHNLPRYLGEFRFLAIPHAGNQR